MIGGGERLVLTLADELNWMVKGGFIQPELFQSGEFKPIPGTLKAFSGFTPLRMLSLMRKWQNHTVKDKDNIIYSGVYTPLSVTNNQANNILYCNTPPRFVYDKREFYLNTLPQWQASLFKYLLSYFKKQYEHSIVKMDRIIANSEHIQQRIKTHLGLSSEVIYPPCDTLRFEWLSQGDYYLSTARLDGLKRVEYIVRAFVQMPDKKLIVASGGSELEKLQRLAVDADNITFTNWISQQRLLELVNNCIATIYIPLDEDFGISPVESMAAGKPVIGVNEGGLKETIIDQETGFLLDGGGNLQEQLIDKILQLTGEKAKSMRESCECQAKNFSQELFLQRMRELLV